MPAPRRTSLATTLLAGTVALGACAWFVRHQTRRVERRHPPRGRLLEVDGVRLHCIEHGRADAPHCVVMLHGNGTMAEEIELSGIAGLCAARHRVLVFDRPGYGHSQPPDARQWTPEAQAALLHGALRQLGVPRAIVLGHSWGTLVALAMAQHDPQVVAGLVLLGGYYFPTLRLDSLYLSTPALPLLGRLLRHTVSPLLGRLLWPLMVRRMFAPRATSRAFRQGYPVWMSLRPSQLLASASEAAQMIPAAAALQRGVAALQVPTVLVTGAQDRVLSGRWHSGRLSDELPQAWLRVVEHAGHMVHHAAPGQVAAAVDQVANQIDAAGAPRAPARAASEGVPA